LRVLKPVEVRDGDKFVGLYPEENFSVCYTINFPHPLIGEQSICVDLSRGDYARDIAPARTFGFLSEVESLRNMGLIRGATEENAIVLTTDGIRNGPLRFSNEFVRHKVLDLIGDLSLIGHQVLGRVVADRAGHAMHTALVSRLMRDPSSWELATLREAAALPETVSV
jgi:UDP-3-O-[3-hydroxymyristoyl] N-acetylglucosamine deacetylase